jgi:L-ascorbate metabolism protein UlaG (beta-lactamase superfamily)
VTSSHNHTDHLDAATLLPLFAANPSIQLVIPEANRAFVCERLGCAADFPLGLNDGEQLDVAGFKLHAIPSAHNEIDRDAAGRCKYLGLVLECGPFRLYHSGDTLWYPGLEDRLRPFHLDVAFLPINGNRPERRVAGNLSAEEAARLGREVGAKCVVPHHYHLFEFNTEDPQRFVEFAEQYGTPYRVLGIGEGMGVEN